ncbi:hypothetical protein CK623_10185 [Vandammella animalimorsus]|uniref:Uncharacterized protein n=1 Tax=Vandammella animalimorsus TaxID=2029117 RepID=A0A2A2AP39_9BURK|nr:hypothetical protein CK623_10185 [Vandammella animalimorsus]
MAVALRAQDMFGRALNTGDGNEKVVVVVKDGQCSRIGLSGTDNARAVIDFSEQAGLRTEMQLDILAD